MWRSMDRAPNAAAITVVVNTAGDVPGDTCEVAGPCSLRGAIDVANANAGPDVIAFAIPGAGPHTLAPTTPLPVVTDTVTIDGYSQAGSAVNTDPAASDAAIAMLRAGGNAIESRRKRIVRVPEKHIIDRFADAVPAQEVEAGGEAVLEFHLNEMLTMLSAGEKDRPKLTAPRWRARTE